MLLHSRRIKGESLRDAWRETTSLYTRTWGDFPYGKGKKGSRQTSVIYNETNDFLALIFSWSDIKNFSQQLERCPKMSRLWGRGANLSTSQFYLIFRTTNFAGTAENVIATSVAAIRSVPAVPSRQQQSPLTGSGIGFLEILFAPAIRLNQFLEILHFTKDKNADKTGEKMAASASKKSTSDLAGYFILLLWQHGCQQHF